ncbi:MAG: hypoxanthine phosphoribosyltransferase, partial [Chloroflexi bacterium]|nr:hypoxanthine phosphoribosyltransferase [Chloroflexota bacterium]
MAAGSMKGLVLLYAHDEILQAVSRLAQQVNQDYRGKAPVLVAVLKGAFIFLVDLSRRLDIPFEVDFVSVATYGAATRPSKEARLRLGTQLPIKGRDVLVVEDLVDTGHTTDAVRRYLKRQGPSSLRLCALFDK